RAMIVSSDRLSVHQIDTALLPRIHHELPAFVSKDCRSNLQIEIALHQPFGVRWPVKIAQRQRLGLWILPEPYDAAAVSSTLGIPLAIAGTREHRSVRADSRAGAAPHAASRRAPGAHFLRCQIVRIRHVRIAAATLCRMRVE